MGENALRVGSFYRLFSSDIAHYLSIYLSYSIYKKERKKKRSRQNGIAELATES